MKATTGGGAADHESTYEVCVKKFRCFHDRPRTLLVGTPARKRAIRSNILMATGPLWASLRAAAAPVFHTESLSQYAALMNDASTLLLEAIGRAADKEESQCMPTLLGKLTMSVVFQCAFGVNIPTQVRLCFKTRACMRGQACGRAKSDWRVKKYTCCC